MADLERRAVHVERTAFGRYAARNARGGELELGTGEDSDFTPVELLLAALAGCSAVDVDYVTTRRAEPEQFVVVAAGDKVRDDDGNRMADLSLAFHVRFPEGADGEAARDRLPNAVTASHDRLCTVSRTVQLATPVQAGTSDGRPPTLTDEGS